MMNTAQTQPTRKASDLTDLFDLESNFQCLIRWMTLALVKKKMKSGRYQAARVNLLKILQQRADCEQAHYLLGVCYQQLQRTSEAERCFRIALVINHKRTDALEKLISLYLQNGMESKARYMLLRLEKLQLKNFRKTVQPR